MYRIKTATIAFAISSLAACATTQQSTIAVSEQPSHLLPSYENLSRIEIANRFNFEDQALPAPLREEGKIVTASAPVERQETSLHQPRRAKSILNERTRRDHLGLQVSETQAELPEGWSKLDTNMIRHDFSGMRCPVTVNFPNDPKSYTLTAIENFDEQGRDAGCNYQSQDNVAITLFVSYWPDVSLEDNAAGSLAGMYARFEMNEELTVMTVEMEPESNADDETRALFEGLEAPIAGGFGIGDVNGVPFKTSLWIVKSEGWHIKARATYPKNDQTSELVAAIMFAATHFDVRKKALEEPLSVAAEI